MPDVYLAFSSSMAVYLITLVWVPLISLPQSSLTHTMAWELEKKLEEAAMEGDVDSLHEILQEDPLILHKTIVSCASQTPLHTAAVRNRRLFVTDLLRHNSELAAELDSRGSSPLHLASAKGHAQVVEPLLSTEPGRSTADVRNFDGRTPVHLAAVKGRDEVLRQFVRVVPESIRYLTDREESVLHLCAKKNRLKCLRILLDENYVFREDSKFLNLKDSDGNTVLHIAVANKQIEMVKLLLSIKGIEVNALNSNNLTSLDILKQSPRDLMDMEIFDLLENAHALCAKDLPLIIKCDTSFSSIEPQNIEETAISNNPPAQTHHKPRDWLGRRRSALMVVASLIATVAFQSGLTPPGGVWQDDYQVDSNGKPVRKPHSAGTSVMAYSDYGSYGVFMIFNTIAFLASLSIILLLVSGLPMERRGWTWVQMIVTWIAISTLVMTYFLSIRFMSPQNLNVQSTLRDVTQISVLSWLCLMGVVFIGNVVRMTRWIKEKVRGPALVTKTDDDNEDDGDEL